MEGIEQMIRPGKFKDAKKFGRPLLISPKAMVAISESPLEVNYYVDNAVVSISIGNHTAHLVMSEECWEEFRNGAEVSIRTASEFKKTITTNLEK